MLTSQLAEEQALVGELRSELKGLQEGLDLPGGMADTAQPLSQAAASLMGEDLDTDMETALRQAVQEAEARLSAALQAERDVASSLRGQLQLQQGHNEMLSEDIVDLRRKLVEGGAEAAELQARLASAESDRDVALESERTNRLELDIIRCHLAEGGTEAVELRARLASAEADRDVALESERTSLLELDRLRRHLAEHGTEAEADARHNLSLAHKQLDRQRTLLEEASSRTTRLEEDLALALQQVCVCVCRRARVCFVRRGVHYALSPPLAVCHWNLHINNSD